MSLNVTNQKPALFSPLQALPISGDFDPIRGIRRSIVKPVLTPMGANPVTIHDDKGNTLDEDDIVNLVLSVARDQADPDAEDAFQDLLRQTSIYYDGRGTPGGDELFASQAGAQNKMHPPATSVLYTAKGDVVPAAKSMIGGVAKDGNEFFASIAYAYAPEVVGFYFLTEGDFDTFKDWMKNELGPVHPHLDTDTRRLFGDVLKLKLKDLTESITLRKDDSDGNDEFSFPRVLMNMLTRYAAQANPAEMGAMAFRTSEMFVPRNVVFVNVERHARARPGRITREWEMINSAVRAPVRIISKKQLTNMTAMARNNRKMQSMAATQSSNKSSQIGRAANVAFHRQPPPPAVLLRDLTRVLKHMKQVRRSMNVIKTQRTSFAKANRRHPNDPNRPGIVTEQKFLPDLHVYIDTSGSISERHYQAMVMMLIGIAKKMNVNMYVTSFSHVLSQDSLLRIKDRSISQIWNEFRHIKKVAGGTDYQHIWHHIQKSRSRQERLSIVITDFEWDPPSGRHDHPKNLYYAPIASDDWANMTRWAKRFSDKMQRIEPGIHRRLIGMIK